MKPFVILKFAVLLSLYLSAPGAEARLSCEQIAKLKSIVARYDGKNRKDLMDLELEIGDAIGTDPEVNAIAKSVRRHYERQLPPEPATAVRPRAPEPPPPQRRPPPSAAERAPAAPNTAKLPASSRIPGQLKRSASYHTELENLTEAQLLHLSRFGQGVELHRAQQMLKLIRDAERLLEKVNNK